jgi:hypothetical protein
LTLWERNPLKKYMSFGLPALLLVVAFVLASCGGSGSTQQEESESSGTQASQEETTDKMAGMDHRSMETGSGSVAPRELIVDGSTPMSAS